MSWMDILMDEDPVGNPTVNLPKENEKKGEDNGQGSEASGALSEDDTDPGMKTVPAGQDEISGDKSTQFDDIFNMVDKEDKEDDSDEDKKDDEESEEDKAAKKEVEDLLNYFDKKDEDESDDSEKEDDDKEKNEDDEDKKLKDLLAFLDEDPVGNPTVNLPKDNEKKGEDNGQGSEAAGALSEDDTDPGMKTVPFGEDEISGDKSTQFDDIFRMVKDDEDEGSKDDDKGSDDDDASKSAPLKGEPENKEDGKEPEAKEDDEVVKDFASFFVNSDVVEPDGLPKGNSAEPAKPVDGNGNSVDPIGDPDLPNNLTEPVKLPVASKPGSDGELKNSLSDDIDVRFFYGNF